jgi:hypothetical protein
MRRLRMAVREEDLRAEATEAAEEAVHQEDVANTNLEGTREVDISAAGTGADNSNNNNTTTTKVEEEILKTIALRFSSSRSNNIRLPHRSPTPTRLSLRRTRIHRYPIQRFPILL